MRYLLDTDICSYIIKKHPVVTERFSKTRRKDVAISAITCGELYYGIHRREGERYREAVVLFCNRLRVVDWSKAASMHYGNLQATLDDNGMRIGEFDAQIAAHALALKCTLVTNNEKHFKRIPGLKVVNWLKDAP
jgi:tRNA(fMet)-specific endonuclease VapC